MPPPTRAKRAIELAPRAKPVIIAVSFVIMNHTPRPNTPRDATVIPITEPPLKATQRASGAPSVLAASHVRELDLVAAFMPIKPASIEQNAPET